MEELKKQIEDLKAKILNEKDLDKRSKLLDTLTARVKIYQSLILGLDEIAKRSVNDPIFELQLSNYTIKEQTFVVDMESFISNELIKSIDYRLDQVETILREMAK